MSKQRLLDFIEGWAKRLDGEFLGFNEPSFTEDEEYKAIRALIEKSGERPIVTMMEIKNYVEEHGCPNDSYALYPEDLPEFLHHFGVEAEEEKK